MEEDLQEVATKAVKKGVKMRQDYSGMKGHLEGADEVAHRDLHETLSAELKKATDDKFKVGVCSTKGDPAIEIRLDEATLGV